MKRLAILFLILAAGLPSVVYATGTARIQQPDGNVKTYQNVRIAFHRHQMSVTSADGVGTIVFGKAACTAIGSLVRCYPYDAVLMQHGSELHIAIKNGTAWLNPTTSAEKIPNSSQEIPAHGVVLSIETKRGTLVSLNGTADEVQK
jgi:hypothetical protein